MNTENQSSQAQPVNHLAEVFGGMAHLEKIAQDLSLLLTFAVGSSGFIELHADDRQDLTYRTLEMIREFYQAA